jgi:hypothetical protein
VSIRAAKPKRTNGSPEERRGVPFAKGRRHEKAGLIKIDQRIRFCKMQRRRYRSMMQTLHCLDQAHDPGSDVQMTNIRLDGPYTTLVLAGRASIDSAQRLNLNRVSERGGRAMGLDVRNGAGFNVGRRYRLTQDIDLTVY